jgi:hypothetical protein
MTARDETLLSPLAACLRGERVEWSAVQAQDDEWLAACDDHGVSAMVARAAPVFRDWPEAVQEALAQRRREAAATELVRQRELESVLDSLASCGVAPILLKGAAVAHTIYPEPSLRPRADTDLLIPRDQVERARACLAGLGYRASLGCEGERLFCQFELARTDGYGVVHALDVHWKISTQALFADVLGYDELAACAVPVPALGRHARAPGVAHALLLACIHPAMHHRNVERLVWLYDVHLLCGRLTAHDVDAFLALALERQVALVCADVLATCRRRLRTEIPAHALGRLRSATREPSAAYLSSGRRWHHDVVANLAASRRWADRAALVREILLPDPGHVFRSYGVPANGLGMMMLPALYVHRTAHGAWKVMSGRK